MEAVLKPTILGCRFCGEILYLPENLRDEELYNAVAGFMHDHTICLVAMHHAFVEGNSEQNLAKASV
jgi:hypothetical protein